MNWRETSIARHKHFLRSYFKNAVLSLPAAVRAAQSRKIALRLAERPFFRRARTVALYFSLPFEADTRTLVDLCLKMGKCMAFSVIDPRNKTMEFRSWAPGSARRKNQYGLWEPAGGRVLREIDLFVVPGRAFTPAGLRLGAGGGYYDRFFHKGPANSWGLAFDEQVTPRLPRSPWDAALSGVVTPTRLYG